jgi:hypothetical protein
VLSLADLAPGLDSIETILSPTVLRSAKRSAKGSSRGTLATTYVKEMVHRLHHPPMHNVSHLRRPPVPVPPSGSVDQPVKTQSLPPPRLSPDAKGSQVVVPTSASSLGIWYPASNAQFFNTTFRFGADETRRVQSETHCSGE